MKLLSGGFIPPLIYFLYNIGKAGRGNRDYERRIGNVGSKLV